MLKVSDLQVQPRMFVPQPKENLHWTLVLKSQIAQAMLEHVAEASDSKVSIATQPPVIDQISPEEPDITMLKLMIALDNSSQGVGEVFEAIVNQSRLSMTEFANLLQIINANLASCTNVSSLRNQKIPRNHAEEDLKNILTILGGAHTLWNVGHAIYSKHYGENSDSQDLEKIHKATLVYCIKAVMGTKNKVVSEELPKLPSAKLAEYIQETFDQFFTPQAKKTAAETSPININLMLRLSDFATVVEGNAAMKGGDIGRLMNVWKRWAVISQGIKSLTQYSIHLPQMIILLKPVHKPGLACVILHSYLIAPSGRQKHYLAKDQLLEMKNFWLKFLFNHSGRRTNIERLMNSYSVNITFPDKDSDISTSGNKEPEAGNDELDADSDDKGDSSASLVEDN
ncbi:hypothetical protein PCASD_23491 [Puccinia coronata f. sp. avenae]|nr:hypothetical protein PCASD_23491 [Puccinia coronata f. sp. avenae]